MDISSPQFRESIICMDGEIVRPRIRTIAQAEALTPRANILVHKDNSVDEYYIPRMLGGIVKEYLKSGGTGNNPAFSALRLDDVGISIGRDSRSTAGNQSITSVGFRPSAVIFLSSDRDVGRTGFSVGFDNGTIHYSMFKLTSNGQIYTSVNESIYFEASAGNYIQGYISTMLVDGFTFTWVLTGAALAAYFIWLAIP